MVGMGKGAEMGILIKDAVALEILEKIKVLVIDKTGTLTEGKPQLTQIVACGTWKENDLLRLVASAEKSSEHPLARSIVKEALSRGLQLSEMKGFQSFTGGGVMAEVEGKKVLVGRIDFLEENHIKDIAPLQEKTKIAELSSRAQSQVFVAIDGTAAGLIIVTDPIKKSTPAAIEVLHKQGLKIIMLSGDNEEAAKSVAETLHIDEYHGNVTPQYKFEFIRQIKKNNHPVAMAGDGINDAPALAEADIGIAMGTGTDVAMESSGMTLVKGDLMGIARAIQLSRQVMKNIRQNLFFAFIYNVVGITIAAGLFYPIFGWLLNPMIAALAMSLSSVSVIANALRLK